MVPTRSKKCPFLSRTRKTLSNILRTPVSSKSLFFFVFFFIYDTLNSHNTIYGEDKRRTKIVAQHTQNDFDARKVVVFSETKTTLQPTGRRSTLRQGLGSGGRRISLSFSRKKGLQRSFWFYAQTEAWEEREREDHICTRATPNISRDIRPLPKAERIESTLRRRVVKDDERRGRRTQKRRRRSAAPRGSESAKRIHDHENQRKLDGRGTPTVRRGHRAVRRPRGFGFFSSFFFSFNSSRQTKTFLRCSAGKRDVFVSWKNRTIRRARECRQTLPLFFLSHFVSPSSTLLLPRDETDTSGTGSKLKNT